MGIYPRISTQQHPQSVSGSEAICGWDGRVGAALGGDTFLVTQSTGHSWSFLLGVVTPWPHWGHLGIFKVENLISV